MDQKQGAKSIADYISDKLNAINKLRKSTDQNMIAAFQMLKTLSYNDVFILSDHSAFLILDDLGLITIDAGVGQGNSEENRGRVDFPVRIILAIILDFYSPIKAQKQDYKISSQTSQSQMDVMDRTIQAVRTIDDLKCSDINAFMMLVWLSEKDDHKISSINSHFSILFKLGFIEEHGYVNFCTRLIVLTFMEVQRFKVVTPQPVKKVVSISSGSVRPKNTHKSPYIIQSTRNTQNLATKLSLLWRKGSNRVHNLLTSLYARSMREKYNNAGKIPWSEMQKRDHVKQ